MAYEFATYEKKGRIALTRHYTEAERLRRSEDTVEGPRAFAEKRKPVWKAR